MEETLARSLIVYDRQRFGAQFIVAHLYKKFPVRGWNWIVRNIGNDRFMLEPPHPWK